MTAAIASAALALTPVAAFGRGWWGDSAGDRGDSILAGPDGAPVKDSDSADRDPGAAGHCREAQPALSDEAFRAVRTRAAAWVPRGEGGIAASGGGGS